MDLSCPLPIDRYPTVQLAHGGGGRLMHQLIGEMFVPAFANDALALQHDGAAVEAGGARLALATDSYVVQPLFFPGGDIGSLAVNGTVNDLAMCGARPLYLTAGFILEEGLPIEDLWRIVCSMRDSASAAGVSIVTGDTKVVDRGKGDGIFINTAGVGLRPPGREVSPLRIAPGDAVLLSGDLGRHGTAIMASREGLSFDADVESDCAPLNGLVEALFEAGLDVHCLRDLTRGGLATGLVELAASAGMHVHLRARDLPVGEAVRGACEILGLDPAYVANEGRMAVVVREPDTDAALRALRSCRHGEGACRIGEVTGPSPKGLVTLESEVGATRILDMLSGEQLPRIC